jgi:hypothetical protein
MHEGDDTGVAVRPTAGYPRLDCSRSFGKSYPDYPWIRAAALILRNVRNQTRATPECYGVTLVTVF